MSSEKCNQILGRYPSSAASSTSRLSPPSTTTTATHQTWWHDNNSTHHTENRPIRPRLSTSSDNSNIHHNRTSFYSYPYSSYLSNSASSLAAYNTTDPLPPGSGSNSTSGRRTPTALTSTTTPIAIPIPPIIASFIGSQRKKLGLTMISSSFASSSISTSSASSTTRQHVQGQKRQERQQQQQQQKSEKLKKKEKGVEREKEKEKEKKAVVPFLNSYSPHPRYRRDSMDLRGWCSNSYDDYNTHYRDLVTPSDGTAVLSTSAASSNYSTSASSSNSGSGSGFPIQQQQQQQQQQRGQQQQQQKSLPPLPPSYSSSYSSSSSPPSRRPQPIEHSSEKEVVVSGVNSSTSTSSTSSFLLTSSGTTRTSTSTKSTSTTKSPPHHHHHHHQKTPSEKNNNNTPYDITATPYNYKKTYEIRAGEKIPTATSKQNSHQQQQNPPGTFTPGPNGGAGLEIHQNGRAIWWVRFQTSFWGAPGIFIEGLPVVSPRMVMGGGKGGGGGGKGKLGAMGDEGGKRRVLAATKFKSVRSGFYIHLGDPSEHNIPAERWPQVTYSSWNEKEYFFEFQGRKFVWRSPVTSLLSYLKDTGDYHLLDVDNPGHLLAAYLKDRDWFAFKPIAKMEFYVKLEQGLELMALAAVMGVEERRRRKNAAAGIGGVV
ncbi:hypothetical protein SMMN14_06892 [Sphaerulina musiva]